MNTIQRCIREPFVHFLLIGAVLVALDGLLLETPSQPDVIEVDETDQRRLVGDWRDRCNREPNEVEFEQLIDAHVREEVMYREALRVGLDTQDTIIRRRLAQKLEFLLETVDPTYRPDTATLEAYFRDNARHFLRPETVDFRHVFFSNDKRHDAQDSAKTALSERDALLDDSATAIGDKFPFEHHFEGATHQDLAGKFGEAFSEQIFQLVPGDWSGPIESAFGFHLVFILGREASHLPALDRVRPAVLSAYLSDYREIRK